MSWTLPEGENQIGSAIIHRAASNNLVLTDISSFKRPAQLERVSDGGLYQGIAQTLIRGFHTKQLLVDLTGKLASVADHAYSIRRLDIVGQVGDLLLCLPFHGESERIGRYYRALRLNQLGRGDTAQAGLLFARLADSASLRYRARAMLALGGNSLAIGDHATATSFYREAMRIVTRDFAFDPVTLYFTSRTTASIRGMNGDHRGAVADLEKMLPLARMASSVQPYAYYDYLNTLAVELAEVGRLEQGRRASEIALASPFAAVYPEWRETLDEIALKQRRASRSTVAVSEFITEPAEGLHRRRETDTTRRQTGKVHKLFSFPAPQPAASAEPEYARPQGSQARILDFQQWKRRVEPDPAHLIALSPEQRTEMTTGEKLIRLMDLISHDDTDDEMIDTILEAVEEIVLKSRKKKLD